MGKKLNQPGSGEPNWYEWFVGLDKVVDLLSQSGNIESVTFQEAGLEGIDDVVVRYSDSSAPTCFQVKYEKISTKNPSPITFNTLLAADANGKTMLGSFASGWLQLKAECGLPPEVILYTSKEAGSRRWTRTFKGKTYQSLPLDSFLVHAKKAIIRKDDGASALIDLGDSEDLDMQWQEFSAAMNLKNPDDEIAFLECFRGYFSAPDYDEIEVNLRNRLENEVCKGNRQLADRVFDRLCAELKTWTSTRKGANIVTRETAWLSLAQLNERPLSPPIHVPVPNPVFPSRETLCSQLASEIISSDEPVVFVTGSPGAGKTRLMSGLCQAMDPAPIRFYAFKPLDEISYRYAPDRGVIDTRSLWATLLNQLREMVRESITSSQIPPLNELCTEDELREEVLRVARVLFENRGTPTVLLIDGIDHAARANQVPTFLGHLPSPSKIPNGVKIVLSGQPSSMYENYPTWLQSNNALVKNVDIPAIDQNDIECLVIANTAIPPADTQLVSSEILTATKGNTLSVVYAVHSICGVTTGAEAVEIIRTSGLSDNIEEYYASIWDKFAKTLREKRVAAGSPDQVLASLLYLMEGVTSPKVLAEVFPSIYPHRYMAEEDLALLSPLLQKNEDGMYRPLHNDFRLFVNRIATNRHAEPCLKYTISKMADYVVEGDDEIVRACYGIKILDFAGRGEEILDIFTTNFVMESISQGVPWDLLCEQARTAHKLACYSQSLEKVHGVLLATSTLAQYNEHLDYYLEPAPVSNSMQVTPYDLFVPPLSARTLHAYRRMMDRVIWLHTIGRQNEAATTIYSTWLSGYSPTTFVQTVIPDGAKYPHPDCSELLKVTLEAWGSYAAKAKIDFDELNHDHDANEWLARWLESFRNGYLIALIGDGADRTFINQVITRSRITCKAAEEILRKGLSGAEEFSNSGLVAFSEIVAEGFPNSKIWPICIAILLVNGKEAPIPEPTKARLLSKRDRIKYYDSFEPASLIAEAFLVGYCTQHDSFDERISHIEERIRWMSHSDREYPELRRCLLASACLGYAIKAGQKIPHDSSAFFALNSYLSEAHIIAFCLLGDIFLQYILTNREFSHLWGFALQDKNVEPFLFSQRSIVVKLRLFSYLLEHGSTDLLRLFLENIYGTDGLLLLRSGECAYVHSLLKKFLSAINPSLANLCDAAVQKNVSGFTDHKNYSLMCALELFEIASARGQITETDSMRFLVIDREASEVGGNRLSEDINEAILSWAAMSGVEQLGRMRYWSESFLFDYDSLSLQYSSLLKHSQTTEEILSCFSLAWSINSCCPVDNSDALPTAAIQCMEKAAEVGCSEEVKTALLQLPFLIDSTLEQAAAPPTAGQHRKKDGSNQIMIDLQAGPKDELERAAYYEPIEKGEWAYALTSCEALIDQGEASRCVYERLVECRKEELADYDWARSSKHLSALIDVIISTVSDESFFSLLDSLNDGLCEYGFSGSNRNIAYAIVRRLQSNPSLDASHYFRKECSSKEAWLTANGLIQLPEIHTKAFPTEAPTDIPELVADMFIDSILPSCCLLDEAVDALSWGGFQSDKLRKRTMRRIAKLE